MNRFLYLSLVVFSIVNIFVYMQYQKTKKMMSDISVLTENIYDYEVKLDISNNNQLIQICNNGKLLNKEMCLFNMFGEKINLYEVVNGNKLILKFSELNCNTCVDEQIEYINEYADLIGVSNVLIFVTCNDYSLVRKLKKMNNLKFELFNLGDSLSNVIRDIGFPYFFVIDESMRINSIFIPEKNNKKLTFTYLDSVLKNYY